MTGKCVVFQVFPQKLCNLKVRIESIVIAKCDHFSHFTMPKKSHFTWYKTLNKTGTRKFHLYCWDHVCKVHEWCLFDSSHIQFWISTQKTVHNYCFAKCKTFSTCSRLLMAFRAVFLQFNINSNQPRRPNR